MSWPVHLYRVIGLRHPLLHVRCLPCVWDCSECFFVLTAKHRRIRERALTYCNVIGGPLILYVCKICNENTILRGTIWSNTRRDLHLAASNGNLWTVLSGRYILSKLLTASIHHKVVTLCIEVYSLLSTLSVVMPIGICYRYCQFSVTHLVSLLQWLCMKKWTWNVPHTLLKGLSRINMHQIMQLTTAVNMPAPAFGKVDVAMYNRHASSSPPLLPVPTESWAAPSPDETVEATAANKMMTIE